MLSRPLRARTYQRAGMAVIELQGEVDGLSRDALDRAYTRVESWGAPAILLDFDGVGYINSKGIALIVGLLSRARRSSTRLLACGLSDHYLEIFDITRLSDYIDIYQDEETALREATSMAQTVETRKADGPVEAR